jgi:thioredoxin reductase
MVLGHQSFRSQCGIDIDIAGPRLNLTVRHKHWMLAWSDHISVSGVASKGFARWWSVLLPPQGSIMSASTDVAVIGAGPYGLSIAAHLGAWGIGYRIFGEPMGMWQRNMPPGMLLKSDGKSSDLSDPGGAFTLAEFCRTRGIDHHPSRLPVKVETLVAYGQAFQERFAPRVERRQLFRLERMGAQFWLHFDDGTWLTANHVVVAVGVLAFRHVPGEFARLPPALASHSSDFGPLERLYGREVAILGAGSSALDLAALLHERRTRVTIITRAPEIAFLAPPAAHRDPIHRIYAPDSKIGAGWLLRICDDAPQLIRMLPGPLRWAIVRRTLGPSGGYFTKEKVVRKVALRCGQTVVFAAEHNGRVLLRIQGRDGYQEILERDHLILATGYRLDVAKLAFLSPDILANLATSGKAPVLSANFESSVRGLYFVGYSSIGSFGPVMRFIAGAPHPARRLARYLATRPRPSFGVVPSEAPVKGV